MAFGKVLAEVRRERRLTQDRLADLSGFDRTTISLLERGKRSPTLDTIFRLCLSLDISLSKFARLMEDTMDSNNV
ncbi:helix-turn-helix domain-containing protein [Pseudomonas guariconensis]|uniref:helix-turn-helix domain-containing protein n=1 Tax=Pseudomonas guariconensis TaxID=1288410 RepID=UPI00390579D7